MKKCSVTPLSPITRERVDTSFPESPGGWLVASLILHRQGCEGPSGGGTDQEMNGEEGRVSAPE